ncbi:MAG: magnesium transporter CorA family protein [Bacteroidales bacterium]|nr:magnesium transporter CorA family protein [Bacteroidales bacterium]MBR5778366.1 magnesium transporter CorA family protein [Bacteroidales bacterium]
MIETIQHKGIKWHHISNPNEEDYRFLLETYNFHPLDIEDCRGTNQRPKIDEYDDYYFLILHFPYFDKGNKFIRIKEVKIFWGKDYIITIGKSHWVVKRLFDQSQEELQDGSIDELLFSSTDILLYHLLDRLMGESYTLILRIGAEVDLINYDIFNKKAQRIIELISITRRNIILLNTTFKPQLRLFHQFESGGIKGFVKQDEFDMEDYWGNILDKYQKMFDLVEDYGELIEGLSKTFDSLQANKTNEIMRVLTYFSTIMLPLTVVTGMYGMNVNLPFQTEGWAFWGIVGLMVTITVVLLVFFQRRLR